MPGRRRGARTGRGWDAAPPRPRRSAATPGLAANDEEPGWIVSDGPLWTPDEDGYTRAPNRHTESVAGSKPVGGPGTSEFGTSERDRRTRGGRGGRSGAWADRSGAPGDRSARPGEHGSQQARDSAQVARDICLQQLAIRPRTRAELAAVLRKRGVADQVATEVLDRYDEVGLIDDAAFARVWVTSRHHGKGLARRALANELNRRGVDGELVGAALEEIDQDTEAATARSLVDRKLRTMSAAPPEAAFRRLVGMLARKGYPPGLAITAVKEALAAREGGVEAFVDVVDPDDLPDLVGDPEDPIH